MLKAAIIEEDTHVSIDVLGKRFDSILKNRTHSPSEVREMNKKPDLKEKAACEEKKQSHYVTLMKNVSNKSKNCQDYANPTASKVKSIRRNSNQFKKSEQTSSNRFSTQETHIVEKQLEEAGIYVRKSSFQERKLIYCPSSNKSNTDFKKSKNPTEVDGREAKKSKIFPIQVERNRHERRSSWRISLRRQKNKERNNHVIERQNTEVTQPKTSFKEVLENSQSLNDFRKFLQREFSEENLDFWESCSNFAKIQSPVTRRQECERIYTEFLAPEAPKEVKLIPNCALVLEFVLHQGLRLKNLFREDFDTIFAIS